MGARLLAFTADSIPDILVVHRFLIDTKGLGSEQVLSSIVSRSDPALFSGSLVD